MTTFKKCEYNLDGVKCDTPIKPPFVKVRINRAGLGHRTNRGTILKVCDFHHRLLSDEMVDVTESIDQFHGGWIPGSKDESKKNLPAQLTIRDRK